MSKRTGFLLLLLFMTHVRISGIDLSVSAGDIYGEYQKDDGGYHIFVRKKPDIKSILLTESTKDPEMKIHVYALRTSSYNPVNGDEKRILDGEFLQKGHNSLIDSTPEVNKKFGTAFHFFIPLVVKYGYPEQQRSGKIYISDDAFINMRCFEKLYGDYSGLYEDNPFTLKIVRKQIEKPPEDLYNPDAVERYKEITGKTEGNIYYAIGNEDMLEKLESILQKEKGETLDMVLALDTTKSMQDNIPYLKTHIVEILKRATSRYSKYRCGLVLYRDYNEEYLVKDFPFVSDFKLLQEHINNITVKGGKDVPEAIYEALYHACNTFEWEAENRLVILIGDAPPHPKPRGEITPALLYDLADKLSIRINMIIYPE
ncbi:MAG: VWA domain-containing protein [Spirochaetales bacterium]|nr:VWA domain-containing protein [Spirochaetales bacterium]